MKGMEKSRRTRLIIILGLLSTIGPFSIDMYLPAFPYIATSLRTTPDVISYSLSSYFIGICAGQITVGPLLDRYGRKPPLYWGIILYIGASIGCAFSPNIESLIVFRFFQAAGGCVGMVAPRAIIRDVFPVSENARIFSLLILILGVSPMIAPTVGGYVTAHFGWRSIFVILSVITFLMLLTVYWFLPESKQPDRTFRLKPGPILASFRRVITQPQFSVYAFTGSSASAGLYAYLAGSPFVFMELYHFSGTDYGILFASLAAGLITSSQLNNLVLKRYSSDGIMRVALAVQAAVSMVLLAGTLGHWLGLPGTIVCIFLYLCCQGFSFPNSSALSMAPFSKEAGSASALLGSIQMAIGAMASALVGLLGDGSSLPMIAVMAGCSFAASLVLLFGRRTLRYQSHAKQLSEESFDLIEKY